MNLYCFSFVCKEILMKSLLLLFSVLLIGAASQAQQYQFVYLQTDNKQPFYVRVNDKLYSSSAGGYLVIPKLKAGEQSLAVGFPKNEWPTQNLKVKIAGKDLGFLLKKFDNSKWGLFNFHSMEVVTVADEKNTTAATSTTAKTDPFSNILADVVNTPSIKEERIETPKPIPIPQVSKPIPAQSPVAGEEAIVAALPINEIKAAVPVNEIEATANMADIQRVSSVVDQEGLVVVYVDRLKEGSDTIKIFMEASKATIPPISNEPEVVVPAKDSQKAVVPATTATDPLAPKFIDITLANPNEPTSASVKESVPSTAPLKPLMVNSDCKQLATDEDFLKIRKKMSAEKNDEDMVKVASKTFKQKCYSTDQVKNLSVLFLKDEGKYKLFDAAYPYIHDTQSFSQLESQLTDAYVITRFRAMIRN